MAVIASPDSFDAEDVGLLAEVLAANPSMLAAVHGVRAVEASTGYPVNAAGDLADAVGKLGTGGGVWTVGETLARAVALLGDDEFPITRRDRLVSRLLAVLEADRVGRIEWRSRERSGRGGHERPPEVAIAEATAHERAGTLEPNTWTRVLWGWGWYTLTYQVWGAAFPVEVQRYTPFLSTLTLPAFGALEFSPRGYGDVWFRSPRGGSYTITPG